MESDQKHVAIAGAGIIGLSAALELVAAGYRVTVLERAGAMQQSSWAAAGMLAVEDPENAPELLPLSKLSRSLYAGFLSQVTTGSGLPVPLRTSLALQGHHGKHAGPTANLAAILPELRTEGYSFTALEEASLDPRDLCAALPVAATRAGVHLRENSPVARVDERRNGVEVVLEGGESLHADHLLLTLGAWTGQIPIAGLPSPPVAPRKGQMIEILLQGPTLPCVIRTPELYLVPRGDGRVVVGATVEHAGFDRSIDLEAGERLWQAAAELWPPILQGRIHNRWTGLRPGYVHGIADALPVLGNMGPHVSIATAHFRNGILLAPGTARVLAQLVRGETPAVDLAPFSPIRFLAAPCSDTVAATA